MDTPFGFLLHVYIGLLDYPQEDLTFTTTPMGEVNMESVENAEGTLIRETAESHSTFLKETITEESIENWKTAGLIDDEGVALLMACQNPENYIAKSAEDRAHVDQLIESLREAA